MNDAWVAIVATRVLEISAEDDEAEADTEENGMQRGEANLNMEGKAKEQDPSYPAFSPNFDYVSVRRVGRHYGTRDAIYMELLPHTSA